MNWRASAVLILCALLGACAADRLHRDGLEAIEAGRYEEGVRMLEQAAQNDPHNTTFQLDLKARREAAIQKMIADADRARASGKFEQAANLYRSVLSIESGNNRAKRGLDGIEADQRHGALVVQAQEDLGKGMTDVADARVRAVLAEDPGFASAVALQIKIEQARGPVTVVPKIRSNDNRPVTLQFRDANTKMVFEVLSRQTGINFIFDKDVKSDGKTTIFVQNVPVEQVIELILGQNQLARQVLSENMVLIYPNSAQKQKDYQDQIVKTFYLTNTDPKKAQELLKTVLNAKTLFVDDRANVIVIRDTPETIRMAEKLIASLDLPESEVMMEVEVLEITRSKLQELGVNYPTGASISTPKDMTLRDLLHNQNQDTLTVSQLGASVDLLKNVGLTNVLASPRIRARNKEKAKILIGSKVPVITNSVTPTSGGTAVVTGQVQYVDVGLTLEVEPTVYLDNDVAIKVNLEVSSILKEIKQDSGTLAYQIGTRNATTLLRLKDGETQILAGLINDQDTRSSSHIPGLGDIPIVGRLFGSRRTSVDKSEIVLSITPRIIRSQPRPSSDTTEFWYGTETNVRSAPMGAISATGRGGPIAAPGVPMAGAVAAPAPAAEAVDLSSAAAAPAIAAAADLSSPVMRGAQRQRSTVAPAPGSATISWDGPGEVKAGQDFDVTVSFDGGAEMKRVRAQIHFEPNAMELVSAEAGDVIPGDMRETTVPRINQIAGVVQMMADTGGEAKIQGTGSLMVLHFKALAPSAAAKITAQVAAVAGSGMNIPPGSVAPFVVVVAP